MRRYTSVQRELWSLLLVTGAVRSNELERFCISEKVAEDLITWMLERIEKEAEYIGDHVVDLEFTLDSRTLVGKLTSDPKDTILR